jgi:hypothetical protein
MAATNSANDGVVSIGQNLSFMATKAFKAGTLAQTVHQTKPELRLRSYNRPAPPCILPLFAADADAGSHIIRTFQPGVHRHERS